MAATNDKGTSQVILAELRRARFAANKENSIAPAAHALMDAIAQLDDLETVHRIAIVTAANAFTRGVREVKQSLVATNRELCLHNKTLDLPEAA